MGSFLSIWFSEQTVPEIPLMLLLASGNCITDSSPEVRCQNAPAPPSKTMLLAFMLFTELWSHSCQCSVRASGFWKAQCPIWKFRGRNKLQSNTTAIMERGTGGFFFLPTQNSSGCCRAKQALSVLELTYKSARMFLTSVKYTLIYWSQTAAAHGQNRARDTRRSHSISSRHFRR